ncbi:MAG: DNA alkylation repair protein [Bacilli bacterium]|nr:DNA alkylation repair protein [Bacilli bacterium]
MNLKTKTTTFTKKDYQIFLKTLYENQDKTYQNFHKKLLNNDKINVIGVRVPILRKIAKDIIKRDYISFIKLNTHKTYEECFIHGLILGYIKTGEKNLEKLIDEFLPYNNNWAINDSTASNLKIFKTMPIEVTYKYLNSNNPFNIRFALTLILNHYVNSTNINKILKICEKIKSTKYYVMMANAWLIQVCYVKCKKETIKFLNNNNLNKFTLNKAISKICDSYRVSKEEKEILKKLRK